VPLLECHAASGHHLLEYFLFPTGRLNLGFITEGKLAPIFIKPSLGVSNWPVIYFINYTPTSFLAPPSPRHHAAWWRKPAGEVGVAERRGRGFYRCGLGSKWKGNEEELRGGNAIMR
jgi:hypothetical protein